MALLFGFLVVFVGICRDHAYKMRGFLSWQRAALLLHAVSFAPQVMGIRLGDPAPLAVLSGWNGRKFLLTPGQDVAVAFLQVLILALCQFLSFALGDNEAGLLKQTLHIRRPGVTIGIHDKGQLPQQVRNAQAVAAMIVGEIGGPAIMDHHPAIAAGDHTNSFDHLFASLWVQEFTRDVTCRADMDPMILPVNFEDIVDAGAPFVSLAGGIAEVFAAGPILVDGGDLDGLNRARVPDRTSLCALPLPLAPGWVAAVSSFAV